MTGPLLELRDVKTHFSVRKGLLFDRQVGLVKAVDGVTLEVPVGEILGVVGESGCGKSTLARTILQLVKPSEGRILYDGRDVTALSREQLRRLRPRLQMIFQDPYSSLNPRMTVLDAIAEPMLAHGLARRSEVRQRVEALMEQVGLSPNHLYKYPHEFSGGQRQRLAIARAIGLDPELLIADEPVSALDVSVQAQILNLLTRLCRERNLTLIFIAHDLGVVRYLADRIAVMYLGHIVELGEGEQIFTNPLHPYTRALLSAIPAPDPEKEQTRRRILLRGEPPSPMNPPAGCAFHPRCPHATAACAGEVPPLEEHCGSHRAACIHVEDLPPFTAGV
ncbi:MAG: ATP-binding cassette domain-containing protein [Candidatus Hydrogenedentota bacterium]